MGITSPMAQQEKIAAICEDSPSLTTNLMYRKEWLEAELAKINEAISIVTAHPEVQQVLDCVSSIRGLL